MIHWLHLWPSKLEKKESRLWPKDLRLLQGLVERERRKSVWSSVFNAKRSPKKPAKHVKDNVGLIFPKSIPKIILTCRESEHSKWCCQTTCHVIAAVIRFVTFVECFHCEDDAKRTPRDRLQSQRASWEVILHDARESSRQRDHRYTYVKKNNYGLYQWGHTL